MNVYIVVRIVCCHMYKVAYLGLHGDRMQWWGVGCSDGGRGSSGGSGALVGG